jgi:poly(A) polymerase
MTEREFATDVVRTLQAAGFRALWAGGCVRDELLGFAPADYDVATDARPDLVKRLFRRRNEIGASFGVIQVIGPRGPGGEWLTVEVATFRSDGTYTDGRRPDAVTFSSPEEDARRRDFTINGMFFDPLANELVDYVGGKADLDAKVLRAIGDPAARFTEDKLRILRAVRIATRFGLAVDPATLAAGQKLAPEIRAVSAERIADELRKLLVHPRRAWGVELLREFGLLDPILPELVPTIGLPHGPPAAPTGDLWGHVVRVLDALDGPTWPAEQPVSFPLAFAALLHDVGKPRTVGRTPDRYTFHGHEHVGRRLAEDICRRLRLSNDELTRVCWLVERHQYLADAPSLRPSRLKPILVHPGIGELLALHRADALASGKSLDHVAFCEKVLRETPPEELDPTPLVTGDDLIAWGRKPGPDFKRILDALREAQLEAQVRTREEAVEFVRKLFSDGVSDTLPSPHQASDT